MNLVIKECFEGLLRNRVELHDSPALPRESFRVAYSLSSTAKKHNEYPAAVGPDVWGFDGEIIMYLSHLDEC